jgi:S-(hydroxymethyl)glutathione dehydrogenase / alcohol dehydrogenase
MLRSGSIHRKVAGSCRSSATQSDAKLPDVQTITFRAAVFGGRGRPLTIEELEVPARPKPGEVLVKLAASGLCHSDYHVLRGEWPAPTPLVLGHEGAGVVEAVGEGVTSAATGDHVVLCWTPWCGRCRYCVAGRPVLCDIAKTRASRHVMYDGTTRLTRGGEPVHSYIALGTFGEYAMVAETGVVRIRSDVPLAQASLVGCAVTTGIGAVLNTARVTPGSSVLVIGCGGVGLNIVQGARLAAARQVIAVDRRPEKLRAARAMGATDALEAGAGDVVEAVRELSGGRGVDYAFEAIGVPALIEAACEALAKGGTAVVVGQVAAGRKVSIDPLVLSDQEKTIRGSNYGSARPPIDFPRILDLYVEGRIDLDSLVTRRIRLDGINHAFEAMGRGEGIRTVIEY